MIANNDSSSKPSKVEIIKEQSDFLRGTILEGLTDASTGAIAADDTQLSKFHGIYQQDDRDLRKERMREKLEKAFIFMCRVAAPGGVVTPEQWLAMDGISDDTADSTLKITTRQAFQLHGIVKGELKRTIREINES
ncbi:MAG: sulfite reductase, partial [Opitutales bacterium]